jgi:hypothetical protein
MSPESYVANSYWLIAYSLETLNPRTLGPLDPFLVIEFAPIEIEIGIGIGIVFSAFDSDPELIFNTFHKSLRRDTQNTKYKTRHTTHEPRILTLTPTVIPSKEGIQ